MIPSNSRIFQVIKARICFPSFEKSQVSISIINAAALNGTHQVVEMLLAAGTDMNAVTSSGETLI